MSKENVEIVRTMMEAYERGDGEGALAHLDPEARWDPGLPDRRVYVGHAEIVAFFGEWLGTWESYEAKLLELIDAGDSVIAVHMERGRGTGSGVPIEQTFAGLYEVRDGLITGWTRYPDRAAALEAAGLRE